MCQREAHLREYNKRKRDCTRSMEGQNRFENFVIKPLYKPCHGYKTPFSYAGFQKRDGSQG